jgi:hypothetical protein
MRSRVVPVILLGAVVAAAAVASFPVGAPAQAPQAPQAISADAAPLPFAPNMGDLMHLLIQPRHAKLGLAGKAENWALAGYALRELQQGFLSVSKVWPRWRGLPVPDLIDAALKQPFATIDFAIKAGDPRQFGESYDKITAGCNACHATTELNYVVIKTPDASAFPNQEFLPGKR